MKDSPFTEFTCLEQLADHPCPDAVEPGHLAPTASQLLGPRCLLKSGGLGPACLTPAAGAHYHTGNSGRSAWPAPTLPFFPFLPV